jgi:hypothetical protein
MNIVHNLRRQAVTLTLIHIVIMLHIGTTSGQMASKTQRSTRKIETHTIRIAEVVHRYGKIPTTTQRIGRTSMISGPVVQQITHLVRPEGKFQRENPTGLL